ncbi:phosphotransferase family protein [Amycolatopsis rhabdoformis]|uniref:Phosphotransferase family protein n=1 Tax=Amycolatopsis rhabdoformis TaxID=1448059 RepID=A0ABZ1ICX3_9PSEU|nr:phosphotransferase family protein [Amycolatopsis rhabdoformis]WSE31399.1 phosphotransferase family protein [Amycolatopsis rhabdoformis]
MPIQGPPGVDIPALTRWLAGQGSALEPPLAVATISAGRSNLTYSVRDATGAQYVLRRPPLGALESGAHDVGREARILSALATTALPVPKPAAECTDPGVLGAPFFLMDFVPGQTLSPATAAALSPEVKRTIGRRLPEVLAQLHALDVTGIGLDDLRRDRGYVERQLRRWQRQFDTLDLPATSPLREVAARLAAKVPEPQGTALLHGDFKAENVLLTPSGDVAAVLDWELASVGDPLADLGWLLVWWALPDNPGRWISPPATLAGGFPGHADLVEAYAARSPLDMADLPYYVAFSYWRLSCINTTTRARFVAGAMGDKELDLAALDAQVDWQLTEALQSLAPAR